jgi:uncharacterized membrane protein
MKHALYAITVLAFTLVGCQSTSPRGGSSYPKEGFKIVVPLWDTKIKQGEVEDVTVSLDRGDYFKRDVTLAIHEPEGIDVEPESLVVEAGDRPEVHLRIAAAPNSAIGDYRIRVEGIPETGEPTRAEFEVKIVAP